MSANSICSQRAFVDTLAHHLLPHNSKGYQKVPYIGISKLDVKVLSKFRGNMRNSKAHIEKEHDTTCRCPKVNNKCTLCLLNYASGCYNCEESFSTAKDEILHEIFKETDKNRYQFCERCLQTLYILLVYYWKLKKARAKFQETLLRVKCFKKYAQRSVGSSDVDKAICRTSHEEDEYDFDSNHSDASLESSSNANVSSHMDQLHHHSDQNALALNVVDSKNFDYATKPIRRKGGLTEEEYRAHRRAQMARYYQEKKIKMGLIETNNTTNDTLMSINVKTENDDKVRSPDSLNESCDDSFNDRFENDESESSVPSETLNQNSSNPLQTTKKKYDYKGKTIRRRGGLTEEQYQARRRAQMTQYYLEKRRKLGKLTVVYFA